MQNVLDENLHLIKYVGSIALIYIAFRVIRNLYEIDLFKSFIKFFKKEENNIIKKPHKEDESPIEVKSKQHILFKLPKENTNAIQELNINSYNFTPIVNKFSILTYNILCQKFMMRRDRKDLSLENRMEKIKNEISLLDPDIICLQETVFHSIKLHLENFLSLNYEIFYKENYGSNFYNLTAFKKDKFELKEDKKINLEEIKVEGNRGIYCLELKIKNKNNSTNPNSFNNQNSKSNKYFSLINQKKSDGKKNETQLIDSKENSNLKENEISIGEENNCNAFLQSNQQLRLSKYNKNKEKSNFFYNYKNFIEYNKAENKNKLVIYNVHFPWKPIFDYEKCLILNKIADDIILRNQRNYIIIGDFNSKPNSLLMRMIYLENFINEIKYFKNIINFKTEYFKKRNSEDAIKNNKNSGLYDFEDDSNQKTKTKYSYIDTDKFKSLLGKSVSKSIYKTEEVTKVNELISDFDILKELKDIKNKSTEKKQNDHCIVKDINENKDYSINKNYEKNISSNSNNASENNQNFWTKLSEHKHKENETNKKIKEYDLLKELFYIYVKIQKEKNNFSFDLRDKTILKEILKLFTLSENKETFDNFHSNQNLAINKENYSNSYNLNPANFKLQKDLLISSTAYNFDQKHIDIYSLNNKNQFNLNINNQILRNQSNYFNNDDLSYSEFNNNIIYNPQFSQYQNVENKHGSLSLGISFSNDNYNKIRNLFDNFKNLFIKYKFRSAYDSYQIEYRKNINYLRNMGVKHLVDFSQSKSIKDNIEEHFSLETNPEIISKIACKEKEKGNNDKKNIPIHISDYYRHHPLYTNFTDNFKDTIDYIFYSKYLILEKILKLPDYNELIEEGFLPSSEHPSDHLPLYAEFSTN